MVSRVIRDGDFSCVVAISPFPAECAVQSRTALPMWIDLNGTHPAELQVQDQNDPRYGERLLRILSLENRLLLRGDGFSTPSRRQTAAVLGELLLLGRTGFNGESGIALHPIPHCADGFNPAGQRGTQEFTVVSSGSFNVWFDEETLFRGLEYAMGKNSSISFLSTGGSIPFSPGKYLNFQEMVKGSRYGSRFSLLGWVDTARLKEVYSQASAAIYTDMPSPETFLGARTRALDWISRGIPVVCTAGAEISEDIERYRLGLVVPQLNWKELGESLLKLAANPEITEGIRSSQKEWCLGKGSSAQVFDPLLRWCERPAAASCEHLGRPTVPRMNSMGYFAMQFRELSRKAGTGYGLKRVFRRVFLRGFRS